MMAENQKPDLGNLSREWLEKLKNIRTRAKESQKSDFLNPTETPVLENTTELPPDNELFAGAVYEELSAQQVFAGDEAFYESLDNAQSTNITQSYNKIETPIVPIKYKRFSTVQKILAASIFLIAAMLMYAIWKPLSIPAPGLPPASANQMVPIAQQTLVTKPPADKTPAAEPSAAEPAPAEFTAAEPTTGKTLAVEPVSTIISERPEIKSPAEPEQPLSLKVAQDFYQNGAYDQALDVYEKLYQRLPEEPDENLIKDFLQLQMALCAVKTTDSEQAVRLLRKAAKSNSPFVATIANYYHSLIEIKNKQYLNARTKAYQSIALIDTISFNSDWCLELKRNCYFLAAEAVTREVLALCDADKDLPENLWTKIGWTSEPFTKLDEVQLKTLLSSGSENLSRATLGPQIQQFDSDTGPVRYNITCNGAPIEELLARFAANSAIDLHWNSAADETGIRKRLVYLHMPSSTAQQFITAAAGCAGLLAQMDEKDVLNIYNPVRYSAVSEHISFLSEEALSLWQKFLLRFPADERLANVHFAMGLLYAIKDRPIESIAEYKLVANHLSRSSLAPYALLNSGKLKNKLNDLPGAREDLKQLVEQFPDTEIAGKAYLYLADTTAKANLNTEAARLYQKVYHLSLSAESQIDAALGAGRCSYNIKDYQSTAKWLDRYIKLAKEHKSKDLYSAYFLLGKTYLALENSEAACNAFEYALEGSTTYLTKEEYIESISNLVEGYMQQGHFVQALDMLENIHPIVLSQKESTEILLLKSKVLRKMGLIDKAVSILGEKAEYTAQPQLKIKITLELADCYIDEANYDLAREKLTEILVTAPSGPLAHQAALKLANVCLQLGNNDQAISVCSQLLNLEPTEEIKQKTLILTAKAHKQKIDYDSAALALLGQYK